MPIVQGIVDVISACGVQVMDWSMDGDHNRSVVGFFGSASRVGEAVHAAAVEATRSIDLGRHSGRHPRFGAVDVIPFIPLSGSSMRAAIDLSRVVGRRVGDELEIPCFLYEQSAVDEHRQNLAAVRRLGALGESAVLIGDTGPDFGPNRFHRTAGAVAIGARAPLVAYNVNLETSDMSIARRIAAKMREVRDSGVGLHGVKVIGLLLDSRSTAQVSTNITQPDVCSPRQVYDFIIREAQDLGVSARESELIGIVSRAHLSLEDVAAMRFAGLRECQFLEFWGQTYNAADWG